MVLNQCNLFIEEIMIEKNQVLIIVISLNFTVKGVPIQSHLILLIFDLKLFSGLIRNWGQDFKVFFIVIEYLDSPVSYLFKLVSGYGKFLVEEVPVTLF